jgi:hypothetical protein
MVRSRTLTMKKYLVSVHSLLMASTELLIDEAWSLVLLPGQIWSVIYNFLKCCEVVKYCILAVLLSKVILILNCIT